MASISVKTTTNWANQLLGILLTLSRLLCLRALVELNIENKTAILHRAVRIMYATQLVHRFCNDVLSQRNLTFSWPNTHMLSYIDGIDYVTHATISHIDDDISRYAIAAFSSAGKMNENHPRSPMLDANVLLAETVLAILEKDAFIRDCSPHTINKNPVEPPDNVSSKKTPVIRAICGPKSVEFDNCFTRGESVLCDPQPHPDENMVLSCPYYWQHAAREAAASDLCSLCVVEYDGLPFEFYMDFVRQAHDEARHAEFYKHHAIELMPKFIQTGAENKWVKQARQYLNTGIGLHLPKEGCFYESFWNASFEERLFLMHHDSEAAGLKSFAKCLFKNEGLSERSKSDSSYLAINMEISDGLDPFHPR